MCLFLFQGNVLAQKITDADFSKQFSQAFQDCVANDFKGYSKQFNKIWDYFYEDYKKGTKPTLEVLKKHLNTNKKENEKFRELVKKAKKIGNEEGCKVAFIKEKDLTNPELKTLLFNNFDIVKKLLLDNKKGKNAFTLFCFLSQMSEE